MKRFILICLIFVSIPALAARVIVIHKAKDVDGNTIYVVKDTKNADGSQRTVIYTLSDNLVKLATVASKLKTGLSKNDDRCTIFFKEDGTIDRIQHQVYSTLTSESVQSVTAGDGDSTAILDLTIEIDSKP